MNAILIKNGTVVNYNKSEQKDVLVINEKIAKVSENIPENMEYEIINAENKFVFPGGIDPHVHFELDTPVGKSADDFFTGSIAALSGGTTTIIDFVTPNRNQSYIEALNIRKLVAEKSVIDYSFHISPTWWGINSDKEIRDCVNNEGINSFKIYLAYKSSIGIDDNDIVNVLKTVKQYDGVLLVHCEDGNMIDNLRADFIRDGKIDPEYHYLSRPEKTELNAVNHLINLNKDINCCLYIVHVSSNESVKHITDARKKNNMNIYAETCPHYLTLDDKVYFDGDFDKKAKYVLSPPIRNIDNQKKLWDSIKIGFFNTIGTDHCSFNKLQKEKGKFDFTKIPNGAGGVEYRHKLLYTFGVLKNYISINDFVLLTSYSAAQIFKLKNKGEIKEGMDADLVIWDKEISSIISAKNQKQNTDINIYEGIEVKGDAEIVIVNGKIVKNKSELNLEKNRGKFIKR